MARRSGLHTLNSSCCKATCPGNRAWSYGYLALAMAGSAGGRNMEEKAAKWREEGQARKPTRVCGSERDVLTTVV